MFCRDYKINEAMDMLKTAYDLKSNDPYIIDSIGWAYFLIEDYVEDGLFKYFSLQTLLKTKTITS